MGLSWDSTQGSWFCLAAWGNHLPPALSLPDAERSGRKTKGKKSDSKRKGREGPKGSPEKKEKVKAGSDSVLGQLGEWPGAHSQTHTITALAAPRRRPREPPAPLLQSGRPGGVDRPFHAQALPPSR